MEGEGDFGDPNGRPGGPGRGFSGSGNSWQLAGRKSLGIPEPRPDPTDEGVVVVTVYVDRTGKVVSAMPGAKGTTITNRLYWAECKKAAMKAKFSANPNSTPRQRGTITFEFSLN